MKPESGFGRLLSKVSAALWDKQETYSETINTGSE